MYPITLPQIEQKNSYKTPQKSHSPYRDLENCNTHSSHPVLLLFLGAVWGIFRAVSVGGLTRNYKMGVSIFIPNAEIEHKNRVLLSYKNLG